ncbi:MAG: phosphoglucosamine mutase, partial [Candidatus Electrothrix sp. EH2]|nr:phosphoglucosamine mutase [Candidatus Electrothrix sp. EH2]
PDKYTLDDFHIVLDCAHGATYKVAPYVFAELGAKVTCIGVEPDGKNINQNCGALHPEVMAEKVRQLGANIGLALDGDGDRLIVCDENGTIVDGDHIMAVCAAELMKRRRLKKKTLVATVMSNMGLEKVMADLGGQLLRTSVGDRYVVETMRAKGYNFGGEQSGHLVFLDHNTTGDGILAALQLLAIMIKKKKPLSELAGIMTSYPQVLENVRMSSKIAPEQIQGFPEALHAAEEQLGKRGRILVRPSGTEPVIRVMAEGEDKKEISTLALELCDVIRRADRV